MSDECTVVAGSMYMEFWRFALKKTLELLIERMLSKLTVCLRKLGEDRGWRAAMAAKNVCMP